MTNNSKPSIRIEGTTLVCEFGVGNRTTIRLEDMAPDIVQKLALYGLERRARAAYAGCSDPVDAINRVRALASRLRTGEWHARATRAARRSKLEILTEAVTAVLKRANKPVPEDLPETIKRLDRSARARLRAVPEVAAEIARLQGGESSLLSSLLG